ncbi:hypothetical protein ES705_25467 [subsurface metagenome]
MKPEKILIVLLSFTTSLYLTGQTLEEREKQIVKRNNIKTKIQYDYKYVNGKPSKKGRQASITWYSTGGEILQKNYLNIKGEVSSWEKYEYDEKENRTLYKRESSNSKYRKASKYNQENQAILEAGYSGEEKFKTTYSYTAAGKPSKIIRYINNHIEEKLVYEHSGNTAIASVYMGGKSPSSKIKLEYNIRGNIIEETVLSLDNRELEKKTFRYNSASQIIEEEKTRDGSFYYRITYAYNVKGNLMKVSEETLAKKEYIKKVYIFDTSNNLIKYKWRRNPSDEFNVKIYTYDSKGICLTEKTYYPKAKYRSMAKYQYTFY